MYRRRQRRRDEDRKLIIIHECEDYIAIDKPFDTRIDGGRHGEKSDEPNVTDMVKKYLPERSAAELRLCHQLDYATSGIMLLGIGKKATARAGKLFEARRTKKNYMALLTGILAQPGTTMTCDLPLCQHPDNPFKMMVGDKLAVWGEGSLNKKRKRHSGPASTHITIIAIGLFQGEPVTKVLLQPLTGRRHQLRIHALHLGHPIVGDATYTDDIRSPRMMLAALTLILPFDDRPQLSLSVPDPFVSSLLPGLDLCD